MLISVCRRLGLPHVNSGALQGHRAPMGRSRESQSGQGRGVCREDTCKESQRNGGWLRESEKRDGFLFQGPSLPKALLHPAPGL